MLRDGNIYGIPHLNTADKQRAYDIYGTPVGNVREKMTDRPTAHAVIDPLAMMREKNQVLHSDVMHVKGQKFLISVAEPLQLTLQA